MHLTGRLRLSKSSKARLGDSEVPKTRRNDRNERPSTSDWVSRTRPSLVVVASIFSLDGWCQFQSRRVVSMPVSTGGVSFSLDERCTLEDRSAEGEGDGRHLDGSNTPLVFLSSCSAEMLRASSFFFASHLLASQRHNCLYERRLECGFQIPSSRQERVSCNSSL